MTWIETTSLTFTARHEDADLASPRDLLRPAGTSLKLEDRFEVVPGDISIVIHPSPIWLTAAHPFLPFVRYAAAPAGRRYLAGWPCARVHVLGEAMEKRAAKTSAEALPGPPSAFTPRSCSRPTTSGSRHRGPRCASTVT
ncbi:MAG: hypothetical protein H6532_07955 [Thermoleophilales bacterium]|nr:hypothetical protein [Thermoleophilales bacterium]